MHASRCATTALAPVLGLLVGLAACTAAATPSPSTQPPSSAMASAPPGESERASAEATTRRSSTARVVTVAWGPIWDAVPASLPLPTGTTRANPGDPSIGIASGIYTTPLQPGAAIDTIKAAATRAGYSIEGISSGEDGSVALSLDGPAACRVMVTVKPLGSVRFLSVYYGADCPRP